MSMKRSEHAAYSEIGKNQSAAFNWRVANPLVDKNDSAEREISRRLGQDAQKVSATIGAHLKVKGCQGIKEFKQEIH